MVLQFKIYKQHIERCDHERPVANSQNYLKAHFEFMTDEWNDIIKSANFIKDDEVYTVLLDDNGDTIIPHEVLTAGYFEVSCFGGDLITNDLAKVRVIRSGYKQGVAPADPTPDVYSQIINGYNRLNDIIETDGDGKSYLNNKGEYFRIEYIEPKIDAITIGGNEADIDDKKCINIALDNYLSFSNNKLSIKTSLLPSVIKSITQSTAFLANLNVGAYVFKNECTLRMSQTNSASIVAAANSFIVVTKQNLAFLVANGRIYKISATTTQSEITSRDCELKNGREINIMLSDLQKKLSYTSFSNDSILIAHNNTIYTASEPISSLSIAFPVDNYISEIRFATASQGNVDIQFPSNAKFVGTVPEFGNDEEWVISIHNRVVVGGMIA